MFFFKHEYLQSQMDTDSYSTNAVFRLKSSKIHSRAHWLCKLVEAFLARVLITWYSQSTSFAAFDSIHYNKNTHMVMTLSGVGGILGCSLFMTGTWKIFFAKIKHFCTSVRWLYFCLIVLVVGKYLHQLSNDLGLFFPTEEAGEETSCEHVVDVLEEPLRRDKLDLLWGIRLLCWPPPWCPGLWRGRWFLCLRGSFKTSRQK